MSDQLDFELKLSSAMKVFARNADAPFEPSVVAASALANRTGWRVRRPTFDLWQVAALVGVVAVLAVGAALAFNYRSQVGGPGGTPTPTPRSSDLGIFEPVAGRIVYYQDSSLWAVDPNASSPASTLVRLGADGQFPSFTKPLGWSSDGMELLSIREDLTDQGLCCPDYLYILRADGTETQLNRDSMYTSGATIAPDGSRVVFAAGDYRGRDVGLFVVDAEGGQPVRIGQGQEPTFSPDGTQIAYVSYGLTGAHVWVANADGSDAHEILADEPALAEGAFSLAWSPAGDRIAMENFQEGHEAIYTFAPDGSEFTEVITGGLNPHWSPDGSQIAYGALPGTPALSIADADGSNVRTPGVGAAGPWHPVSPVRPTIASSPSVEPTVTPTSSTDIRPTSGAMLPQRSVEEVRQAQPGPASSASPTPSHSPTIVPSPVPSPAMAAFTERFDSPLHEISISYPSGWQVRPATATWDDRFVPSFHSPTGDVISDPTLGRNLYLVLTSTETDMTVDEWHGLVGWPVLCSDSEGAEGGPDHESYALDTVQGYVFMSSCTNGGAKRYGAEVATGSQAFLVYLFVGSEADQASYDVDWFKALLETVVLPAQATEAP